MIDGHIERELLRVTGGGVRAEGVKSQFLGEVRRNRRWRVVTNTLVVAGVLAVTAPQWIEAVLDIGQVALSIAVFVLALPFLYPFFTMRSSS